MKNFQHSSSTYFNRELALIEFNRRVLAQARNPDLPILSLSGADDVKITGGAKGLLDTKQTLAAIGYRRIDMIEFPNMKHEVLNEIENELIYQRILDFFEEDE